MKLIPALLTYASLLLGALLTVWLLARYSQAGRRLRANREFLKWVSLPHSSVYPPMVVEGMRLRILRKHGVEPLE